MNRKYGILLPIFSLPGKYGIGTLGEHSYKFIDFLRASKAGIWQILPIGPTGFGNSPYQSLSAFAGSEYLIDLSDLQQQGLLKKSELKEFDLEEERGRVNYAVLFRNGNALLKRAFSRFDVSDRSFAKFCEDEEIFNYALFSALKTSFSYKPWYEWDRLYRERNVKALETFYKDNRQLVDFFLFAQFQFFNQYKKLKKYANANGIEIFGDMPLYVSLDSADVWKHREFFQLEPDGTPKAVAGVPPDAFSSEGQLWGNPLFDWEKMKEDNYAWWNERIKKAFELYDIVRIDHFRGFDRYYSIKFGNENAKEGQWIDGPKFEFFKNKLNLQIVAEDLGIIDDGVKSLLAKTGFPGMKILLFGFNGDPANPYLPSNVGNNFVIYTGTHDNLPVKAYLKSLTLEERNFVVSLLKQQCATLKIPMYSKTIDGLTDKFVELAFASKADCAIIPMWDLRRLGEDGRINFPSTLSEKNWSYRFSECDFDTNLQKRLYKLAKRYNRAEC